MNDCLLAHRRQTAGDLRRFSFAAQSFVNCHCNLQMARGAKCNVQPRHHFKLFAAPFLCLTSPTAQLLSGFDATENRQDCPENPQPSLQCTHTPHKTRHTKQHKADGMHSTTNTNPCLARSMAVWVVWLGRAFSFSCSCIAVIPHKAANQQQQQQQQNKKQTSKLFECRWEESRRPVVSCFPP